MSAPLFKPARAGVCVLAALATLSGSAVAAGAAFNAKQFAFSYLYSFLFFFTICAGALFWILVHHMAKAEWSVVVRRQLENIATLFAPLALLFIPLFFVAPLLWSWMAVAPGTDPLLEAKRPYLTPWFFWGRTAFYLLFFSAAEAAFQATNFSYQEVGGVVGELAGITPALLALGSLLHTCQ